jgi:hypothetical protein
LSSKPVAPDRPTLLAEGRTPFEEVEGPPTANPLDAWGGWKGEGWGPNQSLFVGSGERAGGQSFMYRLDAGSEEWVDDEAPSDPRAETINKIRSTAERLYAFFERPGEGQSFLMSRSGEGSWEFESVPSEDSVGGRGLAINGAEGDRVVGGASLGWNNGKHAKVFEKVGGEWAEQRDITPSLMWEIEFDEHGKVWEFYNSFGSEENVSAVYVDGEEKGQAPGDSCANWFPVSGHMYVVGVLAGEGLDPTGIHRSTDGAEWETVDHFEEAQFGSHVLYVPRGEGELWAVGQNPFEVRYTLDGETWQREASIPTFPTGEDTNQLCAIAYYGPDTDDELDRGVWVFARDAEADTTRVFRDRGAGGSLVQVI